MSKEQQNALEFELRSLSHLFFNHFIGTIKIFRHLPHLSRFSFGVAKTVGCRKARKLEALGSSLCRRPSQDQHQAGQGVRLKNERVQEVETHQRCNRRTYKTVIIMIKIIVNK